MKVNTVLLIEQYPPLRLLYEEVLQDVGYEVVPAGSITEALSLAQSTEPDVVVCDSPSWEHDAPSYRSLLGALQRPTVFNVPSARELPAPANLLDSHLISTVERSSNYLPLVEQVGRLIGSAGRRKPVLPRQSQGRRRRERLHI